MRRQSTAPSSAPPLTALPPGPKWGRSPDETPAYRIPLPDGGTFSFTGPFPLSSADWSYVLNVMEAMKPGLTGDDGESA